MSANELTDGVREFIDKPGRSSIKRVDLFYSLIQLEVCIVFMHYLVPEIPDFEKCPHRIIEIPVFLDFLLHMGREPFAK